LSHETPPIGSDSIIIMKFGGTSVGSPTGRRALISRVEAALEADMSPVIVVSAMGRTGEPYATDTLLSLVSDMPSNLREHDLLMSTGELVAAVVVAHELRAAGIAGRAFTGAEAGIGTNGVHGSATITDIHPGPLLAACLGGDVPVVAGFQGMSADGRLTTLGRGGSDTTACALGVALGARSVEIYSDVDGVMTADPRTCDGATVLQTIRADELFQMAAHGSRIVHTPAAELALASGMSVRVRNTYSEHPGTEVADISAYHPDSVATAVSHRGDIARVVVELGGVSGSDVHMAAQTRIYRAMADAGVSLDMFTPTNDRLFFSLADIALDKASAVLADLHLEFETRIDLAKVTLIGAGMHGVPGVMARMAEYLNEAGVHVVQTADSHTTISVLIPKTEMRIAVGALHQGFELDL
jgi:aspartate kinase